MATQRWTVGRCTITSILEDEIRQIPPEMFFPEGTASDVAKHAWLVPDFADRCPHVMQICREKAPPLYQTAPHRATACYLYSNAPVSASGNLNEIFVAPTGASQATPEPAGLRIEHA